MIHGLLAIYTGYILATDCILDTDDILAADYRLSTIYILATGETRATGDICWLHATGFLLDTDDILAADYYCLQLTQELLLIHGYWRYTLVTYWLPVFILMIYWLLTAYCLQLTGYW